MYVYLHIPNHQKTHIMKAIVNRDSKFGWLDGKFVKNEEVRDAIWMHIKQKTAKKIIDTDTTLMYILGAQK
jgi:hypothetical protein